MADIYSWSINTLNRELSDGAVYTVHWLLSASRANLNISGETYTTSTYGAQGFTADPSVSGFIPYEDLQEETCINWVKNALGAEAVAAMEASLSAKLDKQETQLN